MKVIKKSKTKVTERLRKAYGVCEHDNIPYKELEKGQKLLFIAHRRVCRDNDRKGKILLLLTREKTQWAKAYAKRLNDLKASYQESIAKWEIALNEVTAERNQAYDYNTELLEKNKDCIKKNRDFVKTNKKLVKRHIEITRAYNGIAEMGKFAEELGINIKEHQEKLPEHEFNQKHTLMESGRVNHTYSFLPKIKKKGNKK
jgi:hypothetical protein